MGGDDASTKRPAETADGPDAKVAKGDSNGKPAGGCSWSTGGSGGFASLAGGGCSWSTGGTSFSSFGSAGGGIGGGGGFGALAAASGGGFGGAAPAAGGFGDAAPAAAPAEAATAPEASRTFSGVTSPFGQKKPPEQPGSAESVGSDVAETSTPPNTSEVAKKETGEENEVCIHKVRGKLFRLETRAKKVVEESVQAKDDDDEGEEGAPAAAAPAAAAEPAAAPAADEPAPAAAPAAEAAEKAAPKDAAPAASSAAEGEASEEMETRWVERGVGQIKLLLPKGDKGGDDAEGAPRLVMRVEPHFSRLILNAPLLPSTAPFERPNETSLRFVVHSVETATEAASKPHSFLLRVKLPGEAQAFLEAVNKNVPSTKKA